MPQPYLKPVVEIDIFHSYGGGFRDDNWLGIGSSVWTPDPGVTATTNGDILNLSGTTGTNGLFRSLLSINTTSFSKAVARMKLGTAAAGSTIQLVATFSDTTTQTFTFSPTSNYGVFSFTLTSGKMDVKHNKRG